MQPTRPEDVLLTDAFANFLEKCRAKNLSEKTLNIYTVHFKFFKEYCCMSLSEKSSKLVVRYNTEEICFRKVSFTVSNFFCWGGCPAAVRAAFSRSSFN